MQSKSWCEMFILKLSDIQSFIILKENVYLNFVSRCLGLHWEQSLPVNRDSDPLN